MAGSEGGVYRPQPITRTSTAGSSQGSSSSLSEQSGKTADDRIIVARTVTDDGAGNLAAALGTVDYVSRAVSLKVVSHDRTTENYKADHEKASEFSTTTSGGNGGSGSGSSGSNSRKGGSYGTASVGEEMFAESSLVARYRVGAPAPVSHSETYTPDAVTIDLCPYTTHRIVPGSVQFRWMGTTYVDFEGVVYRDRTDTSPGIASGRVDYAAGVAIMTDWVVGGSGATDFVLQSLWTQAGDWRTASVFFMTEASPIQPGQITITVTDVPGDLITVECDLNGNLTGPHAMGKFEFQNGLGELQFGDFVDAASLTDADRAEWWYSAAEVGAVQPGKVWRPWPVDPASLRYNGVSNFYLPVDPEILGLDPVRLPQDGRVPIYRKGRILVIGNNDQLPAAHYVNGAVIDVGRTRLSHVWLIGADGKLITSGFEATEADLDAGRIHVQDTSGWAQPVTVEHRIQDMALCTDVQIDGTLSFNIPLSHQYPVGSVVSSAVLWGHTWARVATLFDQQSWDGVTWKDEVHGNPAVGNYNDTAYPIVVNNAGALSDRFALRIKSSGSTFEFHTEHMGVLAEGSINADFAPVNPIKPGTPLLQLASAGWGSNWVAGNTLFVRVVGAMQSMAVIRTVQPGAPAGLDYSFDLLTGGDIDRLPSGIPTP